MSYTSEQRRNLRIIKRVGRRKGATRKPLKAAIEAGLVESNLRNLRYGDRDSVGVFQQRRSQGWKGLTNVERAAEEFFDRAIPLSKKYGTAGELAQAVQRSAFPGRYHQRSAEANKLLGRDGSSGGTRTVRESKTTPGVDRSADRQALLRQYVSQRGRPDALLSLAQVLKGAQDTPARTTTTTRTVKARARRSGGGRGQTDIDAIIRMAEAEGLRVGEHPRRGGVAPVHAPGSYHGRRAKRSPGAAVDITGPIPKLRRFKAKLRRRYGADLEELIGNFGGGPNLKHGRPVGRGFYSGHQGHLHAADID